MNQHDRVDYLGGQVAALTAFARALIKTHPNRASLLEIFQETEQAALALSESTTVSEAYLSGQRETNQSLAAFLAGTD